MIWWLFFFLGAGGVAGCGGGLNGMSYKLIPDTESGGGGGGACGESWTYVKKYFTWHC